MIIETFTATTEDDLTFTVVVIEEWRWLGPDYAEPWQPAAPVYETTGGLALRPLDDQTFEIIQTKQVLRRRRRSRTFPPAVPQC